jgi:hypothetical protein
MRIRRDTNSEFSNVQESCKYNKYFAVLLDYWSLFGESAITAGTLQCQ